MPGLSPAADANKKDSIMSKASAPVLPDGETHFGQVKQALEKDSQSRHAAVLQTLEDTLKAAAEPAV